MNISVNDFLIANRIVAYRTIAGKGNKTLREVTDGIDAWYEIKTRYDDHSYSSKILDNRTLKQAKELFLKEIKCD